MGEAASHVFNRKSAAPALIKAMEDLASRTGRTLDDFHQITLGEAYHLAKDVYGQSLPDYWRVWASWNDAPDEPAEMGDL